MPYKLLKADRSTVNESNMRNVFGCIVKCNPIGQEITDVITCYVPNAKQADIVLKALNRTQKDQML